MSAQSIVLKMQTTIFALVVLLTVSGSHQVQAQFIHPKIKSKETTIRSHRCFAGESECRPR